MDDFYLLDQYSPPGDFATPYQYFQMNAVNYNPSDPAVAGIDVGIAVSYGSLSPVEYGVFFEFVNMSTGANANSVLTSIYFDTDQLVSNPYVLRYGTGDVLDYTVGPGPNGKPGGFQVNFDLQAEPQPDGPTNGVGLGENLLIGFTLANIANLTTDAEREAAAQSIILGLPGVDSSVTDWILAGHLQVSGTPAGSEWLSATFLDSPPPTRPEDNVVVPEPASITSGLIGLAITMIAARRKRKRP